MKYPVGQLYQAGNKNLPKYQIEKIITFMYIGGKYIIPFMCWKSKRFMEKENIKHYKRFMGKTYKENKNKIYEK